MKLNIYYIFNSNLMISTSIFKHNMIVSLEKQNEIYIKMIDDELVIFLKPNLNTKLNQLP